MSITPGISTPTYDLAMGQVAEWLVWTHLVGSSGGDLHVFLPLRDEGIDGIVHRLSTDRYARVQVKGRHLRASRGELQVEVRDHELADDRAEVVAVVLDDPPVRLGAWAMVVDVATFREKAVRSVWRGVGLHKATVRMPPAARDRWAPWCVPLEKLGERLLAVATPGPGVAVPTTGDVAIEEREAGIGGEEWPAGVAREEWLAGVAREEWLANVRAGYRAEMELLRRTADVSRLCVFKAHPDLEPNEYVVYDLVSRGIFGMQVKAVTLGGRDDTSVNVARSALRPSPTTWFVVLTADDPDGPFDEVCAVVPSEVVAQHLSGAGREGKLSVSRGFGGRLAEWRVGLDELGARLAEVAASVA